MSGEAYEFSPSQVDTFLSTCRRKWAWRKIARVDTPSGDSALLGTEMHTQLENHLQGKGLDFTHPKGAGYIAAAGIHLIPDPSLEGKTDEEIVELAHSVDIEGAFRFTSPDTGFVWNGRKDVEVADSRIIPGLLEEMIEAGEQLTDGPVPAVIDHKSCGSLRWMKTREDLVWDVQANVYAHELMTRRRVLIADLVWVYYQTKGAKAARRTHLRITASQAAHKFRLIEGVGREMASYLDAARAFAAEVEGPPDLRAFVQSMPANPSACRSYGGCPYESVCQLTYQESVKASMSESSFLDSLKKRAEAEDAGTPPAVMGMSDKDVPAPSGLPAWLLAPPSSVPTPPPSFVMPSPAAVVSINPIESTIPRPTLPPSPTAPLAQLPPELVPSPTLPAVDTSPTPTPEAEKRKGGRPKGSRNKATATTVVVNVSGPVDGAALVAQMAANANPAARIDAPAGPIPPVHQDSTNDDRHPGDTFPDDGFTLYVDCFPCCAYAPAEDFIARAKQVIASQDWPDGKGGTQRVADYRFLPFGQGAGALAGAVLAEVLKNPPAHLVLSTRTPEGAVVANDLIARAAFVVRGAA